MRCALLCAALAALGCGKGELPLQRVARGEAQVTGRGVLVVAIDGLRYDRTSLGRSDRDTTPFLRRVAAEGVSFDDAWGTSTSRFDAHVSVLTGADPLIARRPPLPDAARGEPSSFPLVLPSDAPSLAAGFLAGGWRTAAFVDHSELSKVRGLDRGFQEFTEHAGRGNSDDRLGEGVFGVGARVIKWVNSRGLDEDWFAYVHLGDLERVFGQPPLPVPDAWRATLPEHEDALPVGREERIFHALPASKVNGHATRLSELELQYDAGLAAVDRVLERIVRHVDELGRASQVTVVVIGAYGVPFGESGLYLGAGLPDGPDLRVPWVMRPASGLTLPPGRRVDAVASLSDVAPTLLELYGLAPDPNMFGLSRASELRDPAAPPARVFHYARSHAGSGACVVSDTEHWALLFPATGGGELAESWTGHVGVDRETRRSVLIRRSGPRAVDSVHLLERPTADERATQAPRARWQRWASLTAEARDALHFQAGHDLARLVRDLRELQQR